MIENDDFERFMDMPGRDSRDATAGPDLDMADLWQAADPVELLIWQMESWGEETLSHDEREHLAELRAELAERKQLEAER